MPSEQEWVEGIPIKVEPIKEEGSIVGYRGYIGSPTAPFIPDLFDVPEVAMVDKDIIGFETRNNITLDEDGNKVSDGVEPAYGPEETLQLCRKIAKNAAELTVVEVKQ